MAGGQDWLAVGYVRRPHGIHGEVTAEVTTDFPERLEPGIEVGWGGPSGPSRTLVLERVRLHKGAWLLELRGLATREDAETLRDGWLFLPAMPRGELPENYYYEHELSGLVARDTNGRELGRVDALEPASGTPLLRLSTPSGEALVPFRSPIVVRVDLQAGVVVLDPPRGLVDGDAL